MYEILEYKVYIKGVKIDPDLLIDSGDNSNPHNKGDLSPINSITSI